MFSTPTRSLSGQWPRMFERAHLMFRLIASCLLMAAGSACGGGASGPTTPSSPPAPRAPQLSVQVSPNPVPATIRSVGTASVSLRIAANITVRESAGASAQVTSIAASVVQQPGNVSTDGTLTAALSVPALGTASQEVTQDFEVAAVVDSIKWRVTVSGADASGRAFSVTSDEIVINPPALQPPAQPTQARYELWGGPNYSVFLGCFSCNQFASESVFNQFGQYGSRFSQTSVWNHFSSYGSRFSGDSACNQFASNPPIILNTVTNRYTELTVNQFRPFADPNTMAFLRTTICEL